VKKTPFDFETWAAQRRLKKVAAKSAKPKLKRETFETDRAMDFFSKDELVKQTGHDIDDWPLVIVKELVDNSLDACEDPDVAPIIHVTADACGITVRDNGPGLPERTLQGALDFGVRASNREAYVAPDRGAQGNALKTLLPMPRVLDAEHGKFIVEAHGKCHVITCGADPISQQAVIQDDVTDLPKRSMGTSIRIEWAKRVDDEGNVLWPFGEDCYPSCREEELYEPMRLRERFLRLVEGFAVFNPHMTLHLDWFDDKTAWKATEPTWKKWKPCYPTSPHWYEGRRRWRG
jgi:hypothetical protein